MKTFQETACHYGNLLRNYPFLILILLLPFFLFKCSDPGPFIPERHEELSEERYKEFCGELEKAYAEGNEYLIAFQLANLKAPNELIFKHLKNSSEEGCFKIFQWYYLASENGFYQSLYKADTVQFKEALELCLQKMGDNAYQDFRDREKKETEDYLKNRPKLDSTLFIPELIQALTVILEDDQRYRTILADGRLSHSEEKENRLWKLQKELDSLNLLKIDTILSKYDYPTRSEVGYELDDAVWLVLHHQTNVSVREKYFEQIKDYLSDGQIDLFNKRTRYIKQEENL